MCAAHARYCSKIAEAEAVVSVNEKEWLVMHVQLRLVEHARCCCVKLCCSKIAEAEAA